MFALERLLREGPHRRGFSSGVRPGSWFFPTPIHLAWIIYNASFAFRAQDHAGGRSNARNITTSCPRSSDLCCVQIGPHVSTQSPKLSVMKL